MFKVIDITKRAWQVIKRDWIFYLGSSLVLNILAYISEDIYPHRRAMVEFSAETISIWTICAHIVATLLAIYSVFIAANILKKIVDTDAGTERLTAKDLKGIFSINKRSWKVFVISLCFVGIFVVGLITLSLLGVEAGTAVFLLMIPGVVLLLMYSFAQAIVLDKNKSALIGGAFKESKQITDGHKVDLFMFSLRTGILLLIFLIAYGIIIGLFSAFIFKITIASVYILMLFFIPFVNIVFVDIYKKLQAMYMTRPANAGSVISPSAHIAQPTVSATPKNEILPESPSTDIPEQIIDENK